MLYKIKEKNSNKTKPEIHAAGLPVKFPQTIIIIPVPNEYRVDVFCLYTWIVSFLRLETIGGLFCLYFFIVQRDPYPAYGSVQFMAVIIKVDFK